MSFLSSAAGLCFLDRITYPEISVPEGSFSFLTGPSGCGKSSYLRLRNATAAPTRGALYYNGQDIATLPPLDYRREVLLCPQQVYLPEGSIAEAFDFYYRALDTAPPDLPAIEEWLSRCCLSLPADSPCGNLSGGERQRVFLSIFLSQGPRVLLLDEPTAALDEQTATSLFTAFSALRTELAMTILCVCHSAALTARFADTVFELEGL